MRIDQHGVDAGAAEHGGCERAGESAAGDDNVGVPHCTSQNANVHTRKCSRNDKALSRNRRRSGDYGIKARIGVAA